MILRFLFVLSVILTGAFLPQAEASSLQKPPQIAPETLQGVWSWPDCSFASTIMVISQFFRLTVEQNLFLDPNHPTEFTRLSPVKAWRSEKSGDDMLHYYRLSNKESYVLKMGNDGMLRSDYKLVAPQQPLQSAWDSDQDEYAMKFTRCDKVFGTKTSLTEDEMSVPFLMDQAINACGKIGYEDFPKAVSCHVALFEIADGDKNHTLDAAELIRVYKQVGFLSLLMTACGPNAPHYPGPIPRESAEFLTQALDRLDQDHNGSLDEKEVMSGLSNPLFMQGRLYQFVDRSRTVRSLLPFLPLADGDKVCTNIPIVEEEEWTGVVTPTPPPPDDPLGLGMGSCGGCKALAPVPDEIP